MWPAQHKELGLRGVLGFSHIARIKIVEFNGFKFSKHILSIFHGPGMVMYLGDAKPNQMRDKEITGMPKVYQNNHHF